MLGLTLLLLFALALVLAIMTACLLRGISRPPRKTFAKALARGEPTDPAELGWRAEAVTIRLSDGQTSPGWLIAGDEPEGPAVVGLHGFGDSRLGALTWVDWLKPYASRVLVYDQRGHGESTTAISTGGSPEAADVLGSIEQCLPTGPVVLFGYSMGAQLAIAASAKAEPPMRRRLAGVIAEGPYRRWPVPVARMLRCMGYPAQPTLWLTEAVSWLIRGKDAFFDRCEDAAAMNCPLLILHGRGDALCPIAEAEAIAAAAHDAMFVSIEDGTHLDLAAIAPQRYRRALEQFFDRLASPPSAQADQSSMPSPRGSSL